MKYSITKYEEKSDALFICIISQDNPVAIKYNFPEDERRDEASRKATIERLIAELEIINDEYVAPEPYISKLEEARAIEVDNANIAAIKAQKIEEKIAEKAKLAEEARLAEEAAAGG